MELNVFDRVTLLSVFPKEGDFTTLKIIHKLREDLSFSEEEHKALQFKFTDGTVRWNAEADKLKEISIGEKATDIIKDALKKLDKEKKLTEAHMGIYMKFIGEDDGK